MTRIRLTEAGKALVDKLGSKKRRDAKLQEDVLKEYTVKQTGEKVLVNENRIFPKKPDHTRWAA